MSVSVSAACSVSNSKGVTMTQVNPDPHGAGYVYQPTHAVTAHFPRGVNLETLQKARATAGLASDQLQVFQGQAGADKLDLKGERHGGWVQFRRKLEQIFEPYESWVYDQAEEILRSGGVVVVLFTEGDQDRKAREVEFLKLHGGQAVRYWGPKSIEIFF
jgi:hypothetical protein